MSTNTAVQQPQKDGAGVYLGVVLLVVLPAVLAFICSKWFPYGSRHFTSGLWFFYEASRAMAYLGIALAAIFTVASGISTNCLREGRGPDGLVDRSGSRLTLVRRTQVPESVVTRRMARRPSRRILWRVRHPQIVLIGRRRR
jgi:hypothetical protein